MKRKFQVPDSLRSDMSKSRWFRAFVLLTVAASCVCSQLAIAQARAHARVRIAPRNHKQAQVRSDTGSEPTPDLYPLWQAFAATPYPNPFNTDGTELWPCFGNSPNTDPNPDCPYIGDPAVTFPINAVAVGVPQYGWLLSACDGTTTGSGVPGSNSYVPCGQAETFYEDWTQDLTDDILYEVVITQVQNGALSILVDTGIQDFGNSRDYLGATAADYPLDIVFYQDLNFGALGMTGENNGNCEPSYNYPQSDAQGPYYSIAANKTCVDPVAGPATMTTTIALANPAWKCIVDPAHNSVCTVKYTYKYKNV